MDKDELLHWYDKSTAAFSQKLDEAVDLSKELVGHRVDDKYAWGTWIFTRVVAIGVNIEKLLGTSRFDKPPQTSLDYGCVSSLCRDELETIILLLYVTEDVADDVRAMRKSLFDMHDCISREALFRWLGHEAEAEKFAQTLPELRRRLQEQPAFQRLNQAYRKILLKGDKSRTSSSESILEALGADVGHYKAMIKLWSANIHATPLSWYRMADHAGGRGLDNARDRSYIANSLEYLTQFLEHAIKTMKGQLAAIELLEKNQKDELQKATEKPKA